MGKFLIPILIFIPAVTVIMFLRLIRGCKCPVFCKTACRRSVEPSGQPKPDVLNCRVKLTKEKNANSILDTFSLEICGSIYAPSDRHYVIVKISVTDATDGIHEAKPVYSNVDQWQMKHSQVFCYSAELGRLPDSVTTLSDWMALARVPADWLTFPRKGRRNLQFRTSILSRQSGEQLACATCNFTYENDSLGYIDLKENSRRAKALAVPLAFAVAAADKRISDCEVEVIENWAGNNIALSKASNKAKLKLNKLLGCTLTFFRNYNSTRSYKICKKIARIAPLAVRCDILDLCLRVVGANDLAAGEQLGLLKNVANWLEVHRERLRSMMEEVLPLRMQEVEDIEISLGITSDMNKNQTCRHLSKEYRKWNARVTNSNPEIQAQAEHMLKLIGETRSQYVA